MQVKSSAFKSMGIIPPKFTCQGEDISSPLEIIDLPDLCKSLAIIMDDPDAPNGTWDHWLIWNIAPTTEIAENAHLHGAIYGKNSWGKLAYGGPCPPSGKHRYFFKVYALDSLLSLTKGSNKKNLNEAMRSHILDFAELIGLYQKT